MAAACKIHYNVAQHEHSHSEYTRECVRVGVKIFGGDIQTSTLVLLEFARLFVVVIVLVLL